MRGLHISRWLDWRGFEVPDLKRLPHSSAATSELRNWWSFCNSSSSSSENGMNTTCCSLLATVVKATVKTIDEKVVICERWLLLGTTPSGYSSITWWNVFRRPRWESSDSELRERQVCDERMMRERGVYSETLIVAVTAFWHVMTLYRCFVVIFFYFATLYLNNFAM